MVEGFEGQSDDVGGGAAQDGQVGIVGKLEGVGAGAVLPGAGAEVVVDLGVVEGSEGDEGDFLPGELEVFGSEPEADAGPELVGASGEGAEDAAGVVGVGGFTEDMAIDPGDGVGGEDESGVVVGGDGVGFGPGEFRDIALAVAVGSVRRFVEMGGVDVEGVAGGGEQLLAAQGSTGQNQAAGERHRRGNSSSKRVHRCSTVRVWWQRRWLQCLR